MTNAQLYIAVGIPFVSFAGSLLISLWMFTGVRDDVKEIRADLKHVVQALNELDKRISLIEK